MKNLFTVLVSIIFLLILVFLFLVSATGCQKEETIGWIERDYLHNNDFYVTNKTENIFLNKFHFDNGKIIVTEAHTDTYITTYNYEFTHPDTIVMIFNNAIYHKCSVDVQNGGRILSLNAATGSCCDFVLKKI